MRKINMFLTNGRNVVIELRDESCEDFFVALEQKKSYFNRANGVFFWLPPENLLYAYTQEQIEEPCQKNPHSDQASDLPN